VIKMRASVRAYKDENSLRRHDSCKLWVDPHWNWPNLVILGTPKGEIIIVDAAELREAINRCSGLRS
jgi:hypothetical protein